MAFYDIFSLKIMTFMTFYTDFKTLMMTNYMFYKKNYTKVNKYKQNQCKTVNFSPEMHIRNLYNQNFQNNLEKWRVCNTFLLFFYPHIQLIQVR